MKNPVCHKGVLSGSIPQKFNEYEGLAWVGALQSEIKTNSPKRIVLHFEKTIWADPLALIYLGLALRQTGLKSDDIVIDFGNRTRFSSDQRRFRRFLSEQGFVREYSKFARVQLEGRLYLNAKLLTGSIRTQFSHTELEKLLVADAPKVHYSNSECIRFQLEDTSGFEDEDTPALSLFVQKVVDEAEKRISTRKALLHGISWEHLAQKIRKVVFELTLNVAAHSAEKGDKPYVGIYARILPKRPTRGDSLAIWDKLNNDRSGLPGNRSFSLNPYSEWIELFVCDSGQGMTNHIDKWKVADDSPFKEKLSRAKASPNPLQSLSAHLFTLGASRLSRHDAERTPVTGLMHLRHVLELNGDHCRLYSKSSRHDGVWLGNHFPWPNKPTVTKNPKAARLCTGTAFCISIQPDGSNITFDDGFWYSPSSEIKRKVMKTMRLKTKQINNSVRWYERVESNECYLPTQHELELKPKATTEILRPPRLFTKRDFGRWIMHIGGTINAPRNNNANLLIICELSQFQALTFISIAERMRANSNSEFTLILVSDCFQVTSFTKRSGSTLMSLDSNSASKFCQNEKVKGTSLYALLSALRFADSEIFWKASPSPEFNSFLWAGPIVWGRKGEKVTTEISNFLDLTQALSIPSRHRSVVRSAYRTAILVDAMKIIPTDTLVTSIAAEINERIKAGEEDELGDECYLGSIIVTGSTHKAEISRDKSFCLFLNPTSKPKPKSTSSYFSALLWKTKLTGAQTNLPQCKSQSITLV